MEHTEHSEKLPWMTRVWRAIEPTAVLEPEHLAHYHATRVQLHARHLRWVLPVLIVVHLASAGYFSTLPRASESQVLWLDTMSKLHGTAAAFVAVVLVAVTTSLRNLRESNWRGVLFEAVLRFYPFFGALISANAQRTHKGYGFYIFASMAAAIAVVDARSSLVVNALAAAFLAYAIASMQPDPALRGAAVVTVLGVGMLGFLWSRISAHLLVAVVQAELTQQNARENLEQKLAQQLATTSNHVLEIARLNQQLDAQVQQRSKELSLALAKLAQGAPARRTISEGTIVGSRFVVDAPLNVARSVWLADDKVTNARVVLRVAQASSAVELDEFHKMLEEVDAFLTVREPVFVRTVHIDLTEDGFLVQAMEYVPGVTLAKWLATHDAMPPAVVARAGALLARGLAAVHKVGLVHRSISPANVMLSAFSPGVRMLGFGTVRSSLSSVRHATALLSGIDPEFVSPEFVADGALTAPSDVYAAGLVLYRALVGKSPFRPTTGAGWLKAHASEAPAPIASVMRNAPRELSDLIMRCLAKKPEDRPTASELGDALEAIANAANATGVDTYVRRIESEASGSHPSTDLASGESNTR